MTAAVRRTTSLRGDIDGLRAMAILLVVAFHVGLAGFSGGFIGVDVFFVISGYLITRNLVAESERQGRPRLIRFWGRRIRRLVPALGLMLVVVLGLALVILPFVEWQTVAAQARAAALYVSNIAFARQATDYFAPNINTSLFLHTWSLGVEEQFYLIWPLLVVAACAVSRGRSGRRRRVLFGVFTLTFVASLALCLVQTAHGSPSAFFGLPARAWEFAAAGLLALAPIPDEPGPTWVPITEFVVGLAGIATATICYSQNSTYPGWRALLPVLATVLLILAGTAPASPPTSTEPTADTAPGALDAATNPLSAAVAWSPLQWLGRVSYSWYLWHWPFILLAVQAVHHDTLGVRGAAAVVALGVASLAHAFIENPARFNPRLNRSWRLTYSLGATITAVVLVASVGLDQAAASASTGGPKGSLTAVAASRRVFICAREVTTADHISYCEDGDLRSGRILLLEGDSHTRHWVPAFAAAARVEGVRLVVRWQSDCPAEPVHMLSLTGSVNTACDTFHADTAKLVRELRPVAVVTSQSVFYWDLMIPPRPTKGEVARAQVWGSIDQTYLRSLQQSGIKVGAVVDTPRNGTDPIACLAQHPADRCSTPESQALGPQRPMADAEAAARAAIGGVPTLDINATLCPGGVCRAVVNNSYVYVDVDHLYRGFVLTQVPQVEAFITSVMR